LVYSKMEVI